MRELREKWINDFTSLGKEVKVDGETLRPDTRTSIAIGKVARLDEVGKNNLKAVVKVAGAKYDFSGFLNDNNTVSELLKQAKENGYTIAVRFEKKRKKDVSPKATIGELTVDASTAKENIVNIVAGVYNFGTSEWILTDDAVSTPSEDPEYVKDELEKASYSTFNFFESGTAKRISTTDKDWKVNHLISMFTYASEHNLENEVGLENKALKLLAKFMLKACDQLQMKMHNLDEPNYNDYSHTKVRGMLFSWMRVNPLSKEIMGTKGGFSEWLNEFLEQNTDLYEWAKAEAESED